MVSRSFDNAVDLASGGQPFEERGSEIAGRSSDRDSHEGGATQLAGPANRARGRTYRLRFRCLAITAGVRK
jgi:hypothetical protein